MYKVNKYRVVKILDPINKTGKYVFIKKKNPDTQLHVNEKYTCMWVKIGKNTQ